MRAGRVSQGLLWAEGRIVLREASPGRDFGRLRESRKPFALIGRMVGADFRLDERTVSPRHVYLHLNEQGLFGVDLATGSGTRFSGASASSRWLRAGDGIEVAGRRFKIEEIHLNGKPIDPTPPTVSPLEESRNDAPLAEIKLFPENSDDRPWALGSELVFLGRGEACGILVRGPSVSRTHCVLYRTASSVYVIDLLGQHTSINGRTLRGARRLVNGDALAVGRSQFRVEIEPAVISGRNRDVPGRNAFVTPLPLPRVAETATTLEHDREPDELATAILPSNLGIAAADWVFQALRPGHDEFLRRQEELRGTMDRMFREIRRDPDTPSLPEPRVIPAAMTSDTAIPEENRLDDELSSSTSATPETIPEDPRESSRQAKPSVPSRTLTNPFDRPDTGPSTTWLLRRMSHQDSQTDSAGSRRSRKLLAFLRRLFS